MGPARGLFLELEKSHALRVPGVSEEASMAPTDPLDCIHCEGPLQLGGFVVSYRAKQIWVEEKV